MPETAAVSLAERPTMKASALKRVLLVASLLAPTACAERIAECQPSGGASLAAGPSRCPTESESADVALDHEVVRATDAEPVLSVAPPQRRKARAVAHAHSME
ncbi:hypothetical protein D9623_14395 [Azospirillum brasilense]|uniref:Uncharacterized protein n=2 Tax=Azospirillum brasilense TaxID=192 RepID=A0A0P0F2T7_AZOBR|nr:hypothetical protein AMK58_17540 [Azospirillum brasilense]PWC97186.1 hypothetical protein AEJ54_02100 [Azospirillum sp. Sp 7]OPH14621.1 hypothetical protein FE89_14975 [Azospirillum brasilense]OPH22679.1 hypothetical protein FE88_00175 [Azospirillum brasilense]QCO11265.1 hypothetical protein D3868_19850 [Azospirillum brasilense]